MNPPDRPVFAQPWQAQVFAMVVALNEAGRLDGADWTAALAARRAGSSASDGADYYDSWLAALEDVVTAAGFTSTAELQACRERWRQAADRTPHGHPIEL